MPYIKNEGRETHAKKIAVLTGHLLLQAQKHKGKEKYFFFRFCTIFFETLMERIKKEEKELRYKHFNHLDGAFDCAWKELWRRWGAYTDITPKLLDWRGLDRNVAKYVDQEDCRTLRQVTEILVKGFSADIHVLVGEVNFTISEVANTLLKSGKSDPQDLLNMTLAASQYIYFTHAGPYEDIAINKNGDTEGFLTFAKIYGDTK
jgi:hypothetical protein